MRFQDEPAGQTSVQSSQSVADNASLSRSSFMLNGTAAAPSLLSVDWASTALGAPENWSAPLRSAVAIVVEAAVPMWMAWGQDLTMIYNEIYTPMLGKKHPQAMGAPLKKVWAEVWPDVAALIDSTLLGKAISVKDVKLVTNRHGYDERAWFTFSYTPLRDERGAVQGLLCHVWETTDTVRATVERDAALHRLRALNDASADATYRMSADWSRMLELDGKGVLADTAAPDGAWASNYIHPDDFEAVWHAIREAIRTRGKFEFTHRVIQADGSLGWTFSKAVPMLDAAGEIVEWFGSATDVTARVERERHRDALARLSQLLGNATGVADASRIATETTGTTLCVGRAGYGVVDDVQKTMVVLPDWRGQGFNASSEGVYQLEDFGPMLGELRKGEVVAVSEVAADPRTRGFAHAFESLGIRALMNVPLVSGGLVRGILFLHSATPRAWSADEIAFARSVADRTWAAVSTAQSLADLKALNDGLEGEIERRAVDRNRLWQLTRDVMLIAQFDGTIMATNPAWENTLGWTTAELAGRRFLDLIHEEDRERTEAAATAIGRGSSFPNFENRYRHKDGGYRWISWSAAPGDGFIVAAGRDITAAKALHLAEDQLRQSQKMEAVGQLTGGVAHDFNNLLTVISTSVALLRRPTTSPEQRTRSIDAISKTVTRAAKLTGQLLAFARRQALMPTVFDAAKNIEAVIEMIGTLIGARIEIDTDMGDGCFIDADPGQFDTAVVNLAVNARDAMSGAGRIAVEVRRVGRVPSIRSHPAVEGDFVAVSIGDTGTGIDAQNLERIFEPFYTTKAAGHGTGLGLSQVFGFVKQSGGDVQVDSTLGRGTVFTLYFPRANSANDASVETDAAAPLATATKAGIVLVVEDNWEVAEAVTHSLEELGYSTIHMHDATLALEELEKRAADFSAVFSDVVMAGMDGVALAREVRRRWPDLPVVLTSGYSEVLAQDADHGFDLLAKPYDLHTLGRTMSSAIASAGEGAGAASRPRAMPATIKSMMDDAAAETRRQAELDSMHVLDTEPEAAFDDLVRLAAEICGTPIALVSLVDKGRQWFKAKVGLEAQETPREYAFCAHAIQHPEQTMVVEDAARDPRFAANPLVTGDPGIRFYAGVPLVTTAGQALGTLCVIDREVREIGDKQKDILQFLASEAVRRLELRRARLRPSGSH